MSTRHSASDANNSATFHTLVTIKNFVGIVEFRIANHFLTPQKPVTPKAITTKSTASIAKFMVIVLLISAAQSTKENWSWPTFGPTNW
jgi:hypothetical protein